MTKRGSNFGLCRLCGSTTHLIKAHVIPEAFFRAIGTGGTTLQIISSERETFTKRAPIGVYDAGILCGQCELEFAPLDDYGIQVLLTRFDELFKPVSAAQGTVFQSAAIDQARLLRFLVSILWRASVSTHNFYGRVTLGPLEELARHAVLNSEDPVPEVFSAALSRWMSDTSNDFAATPIPDPFREKWDGVNAYRVYFGRTIAYVKADSKPFPRSLQPVALLSREVVTIPGRDLASSKDLNVLVKTAKKSHQHERDRRQNRSHP